MACVLRPLHTGEQGELLASPWPSGPVWGVNQWLEIFSLSLPFSFSITVFEINQSLRKMEVVSKMSLVHGIFGNYAEVAFLGLSAIVLRNPFSLL